MEIREQRYGAVTVVKPIGPLVQGDASAFSQRFGQAVTRSLGRVVLDASAMPFVDSGGLEALVEASEQLGESGHGLKLCGASETLREVLDLTDLGSLFEHYADVQDATRSFL